MAYYTETDDTQETTLPSYLTAGSLHGTLGSSAPDDATVGDFITKSVPLSIASGVNQLYTTGQTIGNWLGAENELTDFAEAVREYDDDLGKYYKAHQQGIDVGGFILSSFVPGMAGVKALNWGQKGLNLALTEGKFGALIGNALGLRSPQRGKFIAAAQKELAVTGNVFKMTEANTLKALATGVGQQALEGAAFMGAVNVTMYNTPVLADRTAEDLWHDVGVGALFGAGIGGLLTGVGTVSAIKRAATTGEEIVRPWTYREISAPSFTTSDRIVAKLKVLRDMPEVPAEGTMAGRISATANATRDRIYNEIRADLAEITGGDQVLAEMMLQDVKSISAADSMGNMLGVTGVGRVGSHTATEAKIKELNKKFAKNLGTDFTPEETELFENTSVGYVKLYGTSEDAGAILYDKPALLNLADRGRGEITADARGVSVGKQRFPQEHNPYRPFNILGLDHTKVEARQIWAEALPKWNPGETVKPIHATDLPLLEKAVRDGVQEIKVIPESGYLDQAVTLTRDEIPLFLRNQQLAVADRLRRMEVMPRDVDTLVDILKTRLGINMNIVNEPGSTYNGFFARITGKVAGMDVAGDVISLDRAQLLSRSLAKTVQTLKHEEGHMIFQALLDARGVTRANFDVMYPKLVGEVAAMSKKARPDLWRSTNKAAIDYRRTAHEMFADSFAWLAKNPEQLAKYPEFEAFAGHLVRPIPKEILDSVAARAVKPTDEEIAKIVNVTMDNLQGNITEAGWNARELMRAQHTARLKAAGIRESDIPTDILTKPQYAKVLVNKSGVKDVDGNVLDATTYLAAKQAEYMVQANRVVAALLGETDLPDISLHKLLTNAPAGPGFTSFSSAEYLTAASQAEYIGQRTHNLIRHQKEASSEVFSSIMHEMANNTPAAVEFGALMETVRNLPQRYAYDMGGLGGQGPVLRYITRAEEGSDEAAREMAELVANKIPLEIPIRNPITAAAAEAHISRNGTRLGGMKTVRTLEGLNESRDPRFFYPVPRNPKDTPHYAFVLDDSVTGNGHFKMIYAKDAETLERQIAGINQMGDPTLKVITGEAAKDFFKARGQYEYERTLNENHIDVLRARRGASASFLPLTAPKRIVENFMEWHYARDASYVREIISARYAPQFEALRHYAAPLTEAAKSKFGWVSPLAYAENQVKNPAADLMKLVLDVQKADEYPFWNTAGSILDGITSQLTHKIGKIFSNATSADHLHEVNAALKEAGYGDVIVDAGMYEAMNAKIPRGVLTAYTAKANAILGTFTLRLDPMNALNNAVGSNVLLAPEMRNLIQKIIAHDPSMADIFTVGVPGTESRIISGPKLVAEAIANFTRDKAGRQWMRDHGFASRISEQFDQTLDLLAITATDTAESVLGRPSAAFAKMKQWADKGEALTGNKLAEEMNRYVAASVAKRVGEYAISAGVMSPNDLLPLINSFVNKTQGNFIASQRPVLFQGPIGQAIGLFQTYQFNLIQRMLSYVGDGNYKTSAALLGMQGSIYGLNGMPGFAAINNHIVANAPGNTANTDMYAAIKSGAGKEAGDWLTYGALSNAFSLFHPDLKINMYTRGDLNPRSITLVPHDPTKIPIYQATARLFGGIANGYNQMESGANAWSVVLRGLEHNGVSRPLAGMAQVLTGLTRGDDKIVSTSAQNNLLMVQDLSFVNSAARIAGSKPLDEAIQQDAMFRLNMFRQKSADQRRALGSAIKADILAGADIDADKILQFAEQYAATGGKQTEFAQFMAAQYKNATVSQANQLREKLSDPRVQYLQTIMGGYTLEDVASAD